MPSWWIPASCAKRVRTDDGLVPLDEHSCERAQEFAGLVDFLSVDVDV